jgi:hypothetical protein
MKLSVSQHFSRAVIHTNKSPEGLSVAVVARNAVEQRVNIVLTRHMTGVGRSDNVVALSGDTSRTNCDCGLLGTRSGTCDMSALLERVTADVKIPLDGQK